MEETCLSPEVGGTILPVSRQYRPFGALNVILMRSWGVAPGFQIIDPSGLRRTLPSSADHRPPAFLVRRIRTESEQNLNNPGLHVKRS